MYNDTFTQRAPTSSDPSEARPRAWLRVSSVARPASIDATRFSIGDGGDGGDGDDAEGGGRWTNAMGRAATRDDDECDEGRGRRTAGGV